MEFKDGVKCLKGVTFDPNRRIKKFKSVIRVAGKLKHLGYFKTEQEAHQAFLDARAKADAARDALENKG
jgi:hypothetical protein